MTGVQVSALTAELKKNFWLAWEAYSKQPKTEVFMTRIPSKSRIENYINWSPPNPPTRFNGITDYGTFSSYVYSLPNIKWRSAFEIPTDDFDDDQTGALAKKPGDLVKMFKTLEPREMFALLSAGVTGTSHEPGGVAGQLYGVSFDTLNFFANRTGGTGFGTGNNLLTTIVTNDHSSGSATANVIYNVISLYHGPMCGDLKPVFWQDRSSAKFHTNAGTEQSDEASMIRGWCEQRGAAGYGIWYNAILQPFQGLPNVVEMHTAFQGIENAYRTFQLPQANSATAPYFLFEQEDFSTSNLMLACSPALATIVRQALHGEWIPQGVFLGPANTLPAAVADMNRFDGWADYCVSNYLNGDLSA